jgi:hypothetical protein
MMFCFNIYLFALCDSPGMNYWEFHYCTLIHYIINPDMYSVRVNIDYLYMYLDQACLKRDVTWVCFYVLKFCGNKHCFI